MFVSTEHHPQLLSPERYHAPGQFQRELERLLLPAWHCVGLASELPREGSFRTFDLLGNPILLWRKQGQIHAYLNVCAHRMCEVTSAEHGCADRLKCQYHGWEYDEKGNVRKMPDARAFRPLEPGILGLKQYQVETCGQLVFVNLADNPPSLKEFLGPGYELCRQWFTDDLGTAIVHQRDIDANWKVLVENALESYHTAEVHPKTFGPFPEEEACTHELEARWTSLTVDYHGEKSLRAFMDAMGHRMVGAVPRCEYKHVLFYPNLMLSRLSLYTWVECILPLSPTRSRSLVRVVANAGRRGPMHGWNAFWVRRWARSFLMRVGAEDAAVLPHVQRGLNAVDRPLGGLISTREERVFHFQRYIEAEVPAAAEPQLSGQACTAPTGAVSAVDRLKISKLLAFDDAFRSAQ